MSPLAGTVESLERVEETQLQVYTVNLLKSGIGIQYWYTRQNIVPRSELELSRLRRRSIGGGDAEVMLRHIIRRVFREA